MQQLSLFDPPVLRFIVCECDYKGKLKTRKGCVIWRYVSKTKAELLELVDKAESIKRGPFGYDVVYNGESLFIRFENYHTSAKRTVQEHIEKYFNVAKF